MDRPLQTKFKVDDWIVVLNTGTSVGTYKSGCVPGDVSQIRRIDDKKGRADYKDPRHYGDNFNLRAESFRKATTEEVMEASIKNNYQIY